MRSTAGNAAPAGVPTVKEHELVRELAEKNASKIVMLVADGLGGLPMQAGGQHRAGDGRDAQPRPARRPWHERLERAGAAGHHARLGPRSPRPLRLRPARVQDRPRRPRGDRHRLRARSRRRRGPRQLLHARRGRPDQRPPRRADPVRRELRGGRAAAGGVDRRRGDVREAGEGTPLRGRLPRQGARRSRGRHRPAGDGRRPARPPRP